MDNGPTTSTIAYLALNTLTAVPFITSNHSPDGSINHAVHCYAAVRIASTLVASLVSIYWATSYLDVANGVRVNSSLALEVLRWVGNKSVTISVVTLHPPSPYLHSTAVKIKYDIKIITERLSHVLIHGLRQHQPIYFRGSRRSSVSVRSHTLVRPRGTHCLPTSTTFLTLTVSESF